MSQASVFIADYDTVSLKHLEGVLRAAGFEVVSTNSGAGALDRIAELRPAVCLIDPMISGIDGFALCARIRERMPEIATVISTAIYKGDKYRNDARIRYGVTAYLEKPYSDEALVRLVHELTATGSPAPPEPEASEPMGDDADATVSEAVSSEDGDDILGVLADITIPPHVEEGPATAEETPPIDPSFAPKPAAKLSAADIFGSVIEEVETHREEPWPEEPDGEAVPPRPEPEHAIEPPIPDAPEPDPWDTSPSAGEDHGEFETDPLLDTEEGVGEDTEPNADGDTDPDHQPVPVTDPDSIPPPPTSNDYEFLVKLGEDEMYEYWKAKRLGEKGFERVVTICQIHAELGDDPSFLALFTRESRAVSNLNHPNIVHIHEMGRIGRRYFIAREYLDGITLADVLARLAGRGERLPRDLAVHIGHQIAAALAYAHAQKDIHGQPLYLSHADLTPRKIFICREGEVVIIGFGMHGCRAHARADLGRPDGRDPRYLPAGGSIEQQTDLYSLGVILHQVITGHFPGESDERPGPELTYIIETAMGAATGEERVDAKQIEAMLATYLATHDMAPSDAELARLISSPAPTPPVAEPIEQPAPVTAGSSEPPVRRPVAPRPANEPTGSRMGLIAISALILIALLVVAWFFLAPDPERASPPPLGREAIGHEPLPPAPTEEAPTDPALSEPDPGEGEAPPEGETELERQAREKLEELEAKREQLRKLQEAGKKDNDGGNR